jgi:twitching motility protein PilT
MRKNGHLVHIDKKQLTPKDMEELIHYFLKPEQIDRLEETGEIDTSFSVEKLCRFRLNAYRQRGSYALALRLVGEKIRSVEELGIPIAAKEFAWKSRGLVLVTGPTGSGKSTTLAALIDLINRERDCHIITIEDPIEYLHKHNKSMVNQREVGHDTTNYSNALRAALREDPDVILIGEMRDLDSISIALTAAETGHLVFSTLHTIGAAKTIDRIIDVFPPSQQQQIRIQLSMTLQGVISQQLLPTIDGKGRVVATEIMMTNPAIGNMIREAKTPQINNTILTSGATGMCTMDNSLLELYHHRNISYDDLMLYCVDSSYVKQNIKL